MEPDETTERELNILKILRDRTYDDLNYFVSEREKRLWRNWDIFDQPYKPPLLEINEMTLK